MGSREIRCIRKEIEDMKRIIKISDDRMNESIAELSRKVHLKSSATFTEIEHLKEYVLSALKWEEKKIEESKLDLEYGVIDLEHRMKTLTSRMSITEHEYINRPPQHRTCVSRSKSLSRKNI